MEYDNNEMIEVYTSKLGELIEDESQCPYQLVFIIADGSECIFVLDEIVPPVG